MASEIKVTFEDGGIYDGFASTYTLGNDVTYYFSFDRDYRVQLNTLGAITLQEYRNAGAWYPIDIITAVALPEIQTSDVTKEWVEQNFQPIGDYLTKDEADQLYAPIGSAGGGVTEDWVKDNFVLKTGDTMTGALKFDFGSGVVINLNYVSGNTGRAVIQYNGWLNVQNDNKEVVANLGGTTSNAVLNFYQPTTGTGTSFIAFRDYIYGSSGNMRTINYLGFRNDVSDSTWKFYGKFETNSDWFFKGATYFDAISRWRSNDIINCQISNAGDLQLFNGKQIYIRENASGASTDYYTTFKYNGQNTVSTVGGQDPRYRIVGYNNFADSVEFYGLVSYKTENASFARVTIRNGVEIYDSTGTKQFAIAGTRLDIYNASAMIAHKGNDGGSTDAQATFQYNGIRSYNYANTTFLIDMSAGNLQLTTNNSLLLQSLIGTGGTGVRINVPNGHYTLTESAGSVTGTGLYTTCYGEYYSESMLNALNACLGHIFDAIGQKWYVQFSGTDYSTGGGKSRGGGVGRQ